ncbi:MAG TPA: hypothetical protein VIM42_02610 [Clostridium sp.]
MFGDITSVCEQCEKEDSCSMACPEYLDQKLEQDLAKKNRDIEFSLSKYRGKALRGIGLANMDVKNIKENSMEENADYLTGVIFGQLNAFCYMVEKGCKPVAMMSLQNRYIDKAKEIVKEIDNLKFYSEYLCEGWATIYIYKHDYLLEVIKNSPKDHVTVYDHWVLGKMFGFSDDEIGKFVESL